MARLLVLLLVALPFGTQPRLQFEVIRATYGAASTRVDVTERVRSRIINGEITIRVDVETLGLDPVPGTRKTLIVDYRRGNSRGASYSRDFDTLRIGNTPVETLRITKALYGDGKRMRDVTEVLNGRITASRLELVIDDANLPGDPASSVKKAITVDYEYNGRPAAAQFAEGEMLRLPDEAVAQSASIAVLRITGAIYLAPGGRSRSNIRDLTGVIRSHVVDNALELTVSPAILKADPSPGNPKMLLVTYVYNGHMEGVAARDGEVLRINKAGPANNP